MDGKANPPNPKVIVELKFFFLTTTSKLLTISSIFDNIHPPLPNSPFEGGQGDVIPSLSICCRAYFPNGPMRAKGPYISHKLKT
ncbi:MAG: hypothetical protein J7L53_07875 [Deltaproteobacteria bacterium]|nr:hypothetical protein [Deltaproteobacteria bacterium]